MCDIFKDQQIYFTLNCFQIFMNHTQMCAYVCLCIIQINPLQNEDSLKDVGYILQHWCSVSWKVGVFFKKKSQYLELR